MSRTFIAVLFAVVASASSAASACEDPNYCRAIGDDAYPPGRSVLSPYIRALIAAREGYGLSSAGFYNDPSVALEYSRYEGYRSGRRGRPVLVERY